MMVYTQIKRWVTTTTMATLLMIVLSIEPGGFSRLIRAGALLFPHNSTQSSPAAGWRAVHGKGAKHKRLQWICVYTNEWAAS